MSIVIYYLKSDTTENNVVWTPNAENYTDKEMTAALSRLAELRRDTRIRHTVMSNENADMVGQIGVDSIVNGKTPDGHIYDWSKAGRAGRVRRSEKDTPVQKTDDTSL